MSVIQEHEKSGLRYMKRQNLHEEARIVGNYYRDIINAYGVDCRYQKLNTSFFDEFNGIVDQNAILQRAYGNNLNPDYSCSAHMITFPEIEQDIFQLQKYGLNPNTDVTFYFDSTDFACALAERCGQYKEFKITESEITCEVPPFNAATSSLYFPYDLGLGYAESFKCGAMDGKLSVSLSGYCYDQEMTVICDPYWHSDFKLKFPSNPDLSKSIQHRMRSSETLETLIFLTFTVHETLVDKVDGKNVYKSILHGKVHGGVLFYSLDKIGKYLHKIHPEVGDILTLDFPDETNAEKYEITDCFDKQLTQDGISPLLHNYVWKCKARRYVNNYDNVEETEADKERQEKLDFNQVVDEEVNVEISQYPDDEDSAYGGYEAIKNTYDQREVSAVTVKEYDFLDDGTALDLLRFSNGCRLVTTGYELVFVNSCGKAYQLTTTETVHDQTVVFEDGLRWLKASDSQLVFVNVEGTAYRLAVDITAPLDKLEVCLNSLFEKTLDVGNAMKKHQNFYTFKESKTVLWATETNLYCRLASDGKLYQLV